MPIVPYIHNKTNHAIAKNSYQNYFKKFEGLNSRKQQEFNKDWWKNLFLCLLPPLHSGKYYLTFDISNKTTFFGTIQKTDEK